jgi:hypothetical protein
VIPRLFHVCVAVGRAPFTWEIGVEVAKYLFWEPSAFARRPQIQTVSPLPKWALRLTTGQVKTAGGYSLYGHPIVPLFCTADETRDADAVLRSGLALAAKQPESRLPCNGGSGGGTCLGSFCGQRGALACFTNPGKPVNVANHPSLRVL